MVTDSRQLDRLRDKRVLHFYTLVMMPQRFIDRHYVCLTDGYLSQ
ncbi:hypothetical protein [Oculatella sp. LEGE 06141]|nr:hypothetical protein [Oculatella sp. LEGE 06141]